MAGSLIGVPEVGQIEVVTIADPGAGNNFSYTVPANCLAYVKAVRCRLQPGWAGIGNRYLSFEAVSAGQVVSLGSCAYGIADFSGTVTYYAAWNTEYTGVINSMVNFKLQRIGMNSGMVFRSNLEVINLSDTIDQIQMVIQLYKES